MEQYNVTGMSCAACSARVEKAVNKVPGVTSCSVSLLTNSMGVEGTASASAIVSAVEEAGYEKGCETFSPRLAERVKIGVQIAKEYANDEEAFSKKIYDVIGAGVGIIESVPAAVSIAYYTQDPNKCCLMCANLGGDTDTIGAMATAICGAFVGYSKINPEYTELLRVQNPETNFEEYINILEKGRELLGCGR